MSQLTHRLLTEMFNREAFRTAVATVVASAVYLPSASCFAIVPLASTLPRTGQETGALLDYDASTGGIVVTSSQSIRCALSVCLSVCLSLSPSLPPHFCKGQHANLKTIVSVQFILQSWCTHNSPQTSHHLVIIAIFNLVCDNAALNMSDYVLSDYVNFPIMDAKVISTYLKPT